MKSLLGEPDIVRTAGGDWKAIQTLAGHEKV